MSGSLTVVAVTAAAAVLALGAIGVVAVSGMSREPEDMGQIYGSAAFSMSFVIFMAVISFVAAWLLR